MDDIPFKAAQTLASWQWLVLGLFCSLLIFTAIAARLYAKKTPNKGSLWQVLTTPAADKSSQAMQFSQVVLSRQAKLYKITIEGVQHNVFETDKGLIELHSYEQQHKQKHSGGETRV
jgi:hypothetical protein